MKINIPYDYRTRCNNIKAILVPVIKIFEKGEEKLLYGNEISSTDLYELSYLYINHNEKKLRKAVYEFGRTHKEILYENLKLGIEYLSLIIVIEEPSFNSITSSDYINFFFFEYNHLEEYKIYV